jgi:HK97 family phage major capsid protein
MGLSDIYADASRLKGLKEQRAKLLQRMENLVNTARAENRSMTAKEKTEFDTGDRRFNQMTEEIEALQAKKEHNHSGAGNLGALLHGSGNATPSPSALIDADGKEYKLYGKGEKIATERPDHALGAILRTMATGRGSTEIRNALAGGSDASGGYTVASATLSQWVDQMRSKSRIMQAGAQTLMLDTDRTVIARVATDPTAEWKEEAASQDETAMTFAGNVI